jgi:hypothetical protein
MNNTLLNIAEELNKSKDLMDKFSETGELPRIEFDILLSKLQFVYDALYHYKSIPQILGSTNFIEKKTEEVKPLVNKIITKTETATAVTDTKSIEHNDLITNDDPKPENIKQNDSSEKEIKVLDKKENHPAKEIIAEKFKQHQPLINEVLKHEHQKKDVSAIMQSKPINNLESAVGINEKFLFIKELFNGDTETYDKTIRIINNSSNFNEAYNYLNQTFAWDMNNNYVQKILDLIRRRFIID